MENPHDYFKDADKEQSTVTFEFYIPLDVFEKKAFDPNLPDEYSKPMVELLNQTKDDGLQFKKVKIIFSLKQYREILHGLK